MQMPPFFYEIFSPSLPRLGPGDEGSTLRALRWACSRIPRRDGPGGRGLRILDLGCGTGAQTIELARHTGDAITALDNHRPYLRELERRAAAGGVRDAVIAVPGDMGALDPGLGPWDLIWAEGSLFVVGFRNGLTLCRDRLAPGGVLAASELSWLRADAPEECREYFASAYPGMQDVAANLLGIRDAGFEVVTHFAQPESAWWAPYYLPLEQRIAQLRSRPGLQPEDRGLLDDVELEIAMFRRYPGCYGNVFYVMQKR